MSPESVESSAAPPPRRAAAAPPAAADSDAPAQQGDEVSLVGRRSALADHVAATLDVVRRVPAAALVGAGLALVALVVAAAVWFSRPVAAPPELALPSAVTEPSTTTTVASEIVVQAAGAVLAPGVYRLAATSRVVDLVEAAGGLAPDADPDQVLLAAPLADGERVYVPRHGETVAPAGPSAPSGPEPGPAALLDLNTATRAELDTLPGVGPATADAIVGHREANGPFGTIDELLDVRGIGPAKLEAIRPLVQV